MFPSHCLFMAIFSWETNREREHTILIMEKLGQIDGKRRRSALHDLAVFPLCLDLHDADVVAILKEEKREGIKPEAALALDGAVFKPTSGLGFHNLSYLGLGSRSPYTV
ncbi:unnamed protein product [Prunus brigantina]